MAKSFDVTGALQEWRRSLDAKQFIGRLQLEELEGHLLDDYEHRLSCGVSPEEAFSQALHALGSSRDLVQEFAKATDGRRRRLLANFMSHYFDKEVVVRVTVAFGLGVSFILLGLVLEGGNILSISQFTAMLMVLGGALGALFMAYPGKTIVRAARLALTGKSAPRSVYLESAQVFETFGNVAILASFVSLTLGAIHVFEHMDRYPEFTGAGAAVAAVSLLYGLLIKLFIAKPMQDSFLAKAAPPDGGSAGESRRGPGGPLVA